MGQVLLVRHGQASWGAEDYDVLSEAGWEQSRRLGRAWAERGTRPTVLLRGSMRRHRETAEAAGAALGDPSVEVDHGWDEFDHVAMLAALPAAFEGREPSHGEFQAWFEQATERWTGGEHDADYSEPFDAFTERVSAAMERTLERAGSGTAAVFTSGGPMSWAAAVLLGADLDRAGRVHLWRRLNPVCINSGVTKLVAGRRGLTLVGFNEHTHLDAVPDLLTYR